MSDTQQRDFLVERVKEGRCIIYAGPIRSGKTALIKEVASCAQNLGYSVELLNVRNYHLNIAQRIKSLLGSIKGCNNTLVVLDDCDAVRHLNAEEIVDVHRSIYLLSRGKGRSVILVHNDQVDGSSEISHVFIPASVPFIAVRHSHRGRRDLAVSTMLFTGGYMLGGIGGALLGNVLGRRVLKKLNKPVSYDYSPSKMILQDEYRKRVTKAFLDVYVSGRSLGQSDTNLLSLLLRHELLDVQSNNYFVPKWLLQVLHEKGLLTKNGQPSKTKRRVIAEVVDFCLLAQGMEGYIDHLCHVFNWLREEMRIAGFEPHKKDYPLSLFLIRTGLQPLTFLSGLLKSTDLRKILPGSTKNRSDFNKDVMLRQDLERWSSEDGDP